MRLFERAFNISNYKFRTKIIVHRSNNAHWEQDTPIELPEDASQTISDLVYSSIALEDEKDNKSPFVINRLLLISKLLCDPANERILLSCEWLFDSIASDNELLSFVQAMVSLEILLGDKAVSDLMGLNELLRNRCAYLIGKSQAQRDEILKDFREIYDVRSQIVHREKADLLDVSVSFFID